MSGGQAEIRDTGLQAVVETGKDRCGGDADGGLGGRTKGGGGEEKPDSDGNSLLIRWEYNVEKIIIGT